jgi:hypothetical protein
VTPRARCYLAIRRLFPSMPASDAWGQAGYGELIAKLPRLPDLITRETEEAR